jgi:hypothetical protein
MATIRQPATHDRWSAYNEALIERGRLDLWISEDAASRWRSTPTGTPGGQQVFSDLAIRTCLQLKVVYGLTLRETEGFVHSLFQMANVDLPVPDYTTLCRRQRDLAVRITPPERPPTPQHLAVDATGLKVYGEGEWKQRAHGKQKKRTWRKLHVMMDPCSGYVTAVDLGSNTHADSEYLPDLLQRSLSRPSGEEDALTAVYADGAYDEWGSRDAIRGVDATAVIPPQRNARVNAREDGKPSMNRDWATICTRWYGRTVWKQGMEYYHRSLSETTIRRFKKMFGPHVEARHPGNEHTEIRLKTRLLNRATYRLRTALNDAQA